MMQLLLSLSAESSNYYCDSKPLLHRYCGSYLQLADLGDGSNFRLMKFSRICTGTCVSIYKSWPSNFPVLIEFSSEYFYSADSQHSSPVNLQVHRCLENPRDEGAWWGHLWGCVWGRTESDMTEATQQQQQQQQPEVWKSHESAITVVLGYKFSEGR